MDLDEVAKGWDKLATVVRKTVLAIPGRAREQLPTLTAFDGKTIEKICRDVLEMAVEEIDGARIPGARPEPLLESRKRSGVV
jgi:hypothetical protein